PNVVASRRDSATKLSTSFSEAKSCIQKASGTRSTGSPRSAASARSRLVMAVGSARLADDALDEPVHLAQVGQREDLAGFEAVGARVVLQRTLERVRLVGGELLPLGVDQPGGVGGHGGPEGRQRQEIVVERTQDVLALVRAVLHLAREARVSVAPREGHAGDPGPGAELLGAQI